MNELQQSHCWHLFKDQILTQTFYSFLDILNTAEIVFFHVSVILIVEKMHFTLYDMFISHVKCDYLLWFIVIISQFI